MDGFRHPHSRKPDSLSLVIASVSFEVICLLNENPPFSNNARNFFFEIDLIWLLTPRQLLLQLMNNGGSRIRFYSVWLAQSFVSFSFTKAFFPWCYWSSERKDWQKAHQECMPSARPQKLHKIVTLIDISLLWFAISTPAPTCTTGNGPTKVPAPGSSIPEPTTTTAGSVFEADSARLFFKRRHKNRSPTSVFFLIDSSIADMR